MIVLTDSNFVIQLYFLAGEAALSKNSDFVIIEEVKNELYGLGIHRPHLKAHSRKLNALLPLAQYKIDMNYLIEEKDYLRSQFESLRANECFECRQDPGEVDLKLLAVASIQGWGLATLEHSLLSLSKAVYNENKTFTLGPIIIQLVNEGKLTVDELTINLKNFPVQENLRIDDRSMINSFINQKHGGIVELLGPKRSPKGVS